ncbi:MAG: glycosyltransferase [Actinomycetota bacterium]
MALSDQTKFNETIRQTRQKISLADYQIIHAVGSKNEVPRAEPGYLPLAYIDDMASAYAASDLVISRSGAVTVTETGVLGIYTLYVPLPIGNGEQVFNARSVTEHGGGEIIDNQEFSAEWLSENIVRLVGQAQNYRQSGAHLDFPLDASVNIGKRILKELAYE